MEIASSATHASAPAYVPKLLTGIAPIDEAWGGFYRGGSYLVYGRAASGRDLITLRFLQTGAEQGESGLLISPARPKDLMIQSASIGFNLRQAYEQGTVRLMRISPVLNQPADDDAGVLKALRDLVAVIRQHRPQRLIVNDFMPFVAFQSFDQLRTAFVEMLEQTDVLDMTMVLVMPQPANTQSSRVIEFMSSQMTGSIHVEMDAEQPESTERRLIMLPNIGHLQRQTSEAWDLRDVVEDGPARGHTGGRRLHPAVEESVEESPAVPSEVAPPAVPLESPSQGARPGSFSPAATSRVATHPTGDYPAIPLGKARHSPAAHGTAAVHATRLGQPVSAPPQPPASLPLHRRPAAPFADEPAPHAVPAGSYLTTRLAEPARTVPTPPTLSGTREEFAARLQPYFEQRESGEAPFLLVAMRMEPQARQSPFDFETVSDVVTDTMRPQDDVYIDAEAERLVVVLNDTRSEDQQPFFAALKQRLRDQVPQQAETLLQAVSAFVVPDGQPFSSANDFLRYVLDQA